LNPR